MKIKETKEQRKVKEIKHKEMKVSKELKKISGITLVTLAITITILLMLAGVTISTITGRDGILLKTNNATEAISREEVIKLAQMDVFNEQMNNNEDFTEEQFKKILAKYFNYDPSSQLPEDLSTLKLTTKDGKYNDILASEIYSEDFSTNTKQQ